MGRMKELLDKRLDEHKYDMYELLQKLVKEYYSTLYVVPEEVESVCFAAETLIKKIQEL